MSARCPVCGTAKDHTWHLVCAECWKKVPPVDQEEVFRLYKTERNSTAHVMKCRTVVRGLCVQQRAAEREGEGRR